jgi:hypothetical protein
MKFRNGRQHLRPPAFRVNIGPKRAIAIGDLAIVPKHSANPVPADLAASFGPSAVPGAVLRRLYGPGMTSQRRSIGE